MTDNLIKKAYDELSGRGVKLGKSHSNKFVIYHYCEEFDCDRICVRRELERILITPVGYPITLEERCTPDNILNVLKTLIPEVFVNVKTVRKY